MPIAHRLCGVLRNGMAKPPLTPPERLRKWRGSRSLREAGLALGVDHVHLHRIESGASLPGYRLAESLAAAGVCPANAWIVLRVERARERVR